MWHSIFATESHASPLRCYVVFGGSGKSGERALCENAGFQSTKCMLEVTSEVIMADAHVKHWGTGIGAGWGEEKWSEGLAEVWT